MKIKKADAIIVAVMVLIIAAGLMAPVLSRAGSRQGGSQGGRQSTASDAQGETQSTASDSQGETPSTASGTSGISYEDYNRKKIGILTGTNMEQESYKYFPDSEYFYYDGYRNGA